mgnify:FL=1|jgi:hypothetical protein
MVHVGLVQWGNGAMWKCCDVENVAIGMGSIGERQSEKKLKIKKA